MAGILPGIFQMTLLIIASMAIAQSMNLKSAVKHSWRERWKGIYEATTAMLLHVIILGGIYSGILTPMETAAKACLYDTFAGFF